MKNVAHVVLEEEDPTEEAEEVGSEQREIDWGGAAQLHHYGHEAVQSVHAQSISCKQKPWEEGRATVNSDKNKVT